MKLPADFTLWGHCWLYTELVKQQKKRAFDICFDPGSEQISELDDRSRQIGTLYMPKIDSDVIIVQLRGGM